MKQTHVIGTIFGSDLRLHLSWSLLPLGTAAYSLATLPWQAAAFGVVLLLACYLCILIREGVQVLAARRFDIGTRDVTLYPFWGVTRLTRLSDRPWQEAYIAATGPVVLALLAATIGGGFALAGRPVGFPVAGDNPNGLSFLTDLFWSVVILAGLHLLPVLPLDGGRVLRAYLAMKIPRLQATEIAARVSTVCAVVALFVAVALLRSPMLAVLAILLYLGAQEDLGTTRYFESIRRSATGTAAGPVAVLPTDHVVTLACQPDEPDFTGFTWNAQARLWIEWRHGQPIAANALIGDLQR